MPWWLPCSAPSRRRLIVSSSVRTSSATLLGRRPGRPVDRRSRASPASPDVAGDASRLSGGSACVDSFGFGDTHVAGTVARMRLIRWSGVMSRAERVVGQQQAVAQHLGGDVEHVLRRGVRAAADQRQRPGAADEVERRPRAGAEADQRRAARRGR